MVSNPMILAGLVAAVIGGLALAFTSGDSQADKRKAALQKGGVKTRDASLDKIARKKQITESLKELEQKGGRKRANLETKLVQAGLSISRQQYMIFSGICGLVVTFLVYMMTHSLYIAAPAAIIGIFGVPSFVLGRLRKRRVNKFIAEFPNSIDIIVRGVKAGLPLGDCMRIIANEASEPVRGEFRSIVETQAMGLSLGEAVDRVAQRVPITETNFFAIVINIQAKAGGNLSEALGNLSRVLRERKKMKGKISAMSMEAKASAFIIGAVPFVVVGLLYLSSPAYVSLLWTTTHGKIVSGFALVWMGMGVAMMKKMITFDF
jgi:tight adherence protein B